MTNRKIPASNIEKSYKDFELIEKKEIPDSSSLALYFRHTKTGLEVLHLYNEDFENLFAFGFRTPPESSCGAAHLIEHSVLCGSERYPLKDPFIHMDNQSVNTYLNAITFPDKTLYPGSSISEKDYFNLMSVYGDAVFFPRLDEEIFRQEGHHLEVNEKGEYTMQGVVFNEMKGNYSDYDCVAGNIVDNELLKGSVYALDSGGDPLEVCEMTYDKFKAFHKKYYRPDNCLVFLYGNIPTERQLDFLQENFLNRLEERNLCENDFREKYLESILEREQVKPWNELRFVNEKAPLPAGGYEGNTAGIGWFLGNRTDMYSRVESSFFSTVLTGHNGTSFVKALIDSPLGKDIDGISGGNSSVLPRTYTVALRGVKKGDEEKVKDFILSELEKKYEEGFSEDEIEGAVNNFMISNKEIVRGTSGPFSLHYMRSVFNSWCYGKDPTELLFKNAAFEKLIENIRNDKDYLKNYLKRNFLDNPSRAFIIIEPSEDFLKERNEKEQAIIRKQADLSSKERILEEMNELHAFQEKKEDFSCLPHFGREDLTFKRETVSPCEIHRLKDGTPLYFAKEQTNGIVYFELGFPMDMFPIEMYPYLNVFNYVANDMGFGSYGWDEASTLINKVNGSFGTEKVSDSISEYIDYSEIKKLSGTSFHRVWHTYKMKFLVEKTKENLDILGDVISLLKLDDRQHFQYLLQELLNDTESTILPYGNLYAATRSECLASRDSILEECWNGLASVYSLRKMAKDIDGTMKKMKEIAEKIFTNGAYMFLIAEEEQFENIKKHLVTLSEKLNLKEPLPPPSVDMKDLKALVTIGNADPEKDEAFVLPCQVGYSSVCFKSSPHSDRISLAESILARVLNGNLLWEQLRTVGGAYGSTAANNVIDSIFKITTYRDPDPESNLDLIDKCLEMAAKMDISDEQFDKAVISTYASCVSPLTPAIRGLRARNHILYGLSEEMRSKRVEMLLTMKKEDLKEAARRLYESRKKSSKRVIIVSKISKLVGKIQKLDI